MTSIFVNKFVDNGMVEFDSGNNVNCQIGLVSLTLPQTEEDESGCWVTTWVPNAC